jgi:prepilin-type N-terminal cleavage/methylation domain-containing protein
MVSLKRSFTLIELIMVIVIIGILGVVAIPRFINLRKDAQVAQCQGSAAAIRTAISSYYARSALTVNETTKASFPPSLSVANIGPYMADGVVPTHPIGRDWNVYYTNSTGVLNALNACTWSGLPSGT